MCGAVDFTALLLPLFSSAICMHCLTRIRGENNSFIIGEKC
jgi:hypothetical protein